MRRIATVMAALILSIALGGGAQAQGSTTSLDIRVTVVGAPCPEATYWLSVGPAPGGPGFGAGATQLTDADGDGVYTLSIPDAPGVPFRMDVVQGVGTEEDDIIGDYPGSPTVSIIEAVTIEEPGHYTFEARVAGCQAELPDAGAHDSMAGIMLLSVSLLAVGASVRRWSWRQSPRRH